MQEMQHEDAAVMEEVQNAENAPEVQPENTELETPEITDETSDDNIEGAFYIKLWREFETREKQFLKEHYSHLSPTEFIELNTLLSVISTGEMEPQYIMRYGFYEGHTFWRTDPIAISFIFGLKSLQELDRIFEGKLYELLIGHFTE